MSWDMIGGPLKLVDYVMLALIVWLSGVMAAAVPLLMLFPDWMTG